MPKPAKDVLASNVPARHGKIFVLELFDVKSNCWGSCDNFSQLHFIQDRSLSCSVKANLLPDPEVAALSGGCAIDSVRAALQAYVRRCEAALQAAAAAGASGEDEDGVGACDELLPKAAAIDEGLRRAAGA